MNPLRTLLFAMVASVALAAPQEPTYDLVWKPKKNDVLDYRLALEIEVKEFRFHYDSDIEMKVLNVEDNGDYEVQTSARNTRIKFQDEEEMLPEEEDPIIEKYDARGRKIEDSEDRDASEEEEEEGDPVGKILGLITEHAAPEKPVKIGEKWSKEIEEVSAKIEYEFVGTEGADDSQKVRVDYLYEETGGSEPIKASGSIKLRKADFSVDDFAAEIKNFRMDADAPAGTAKLNLTRK